MSWDVELVENGEVVTLAESHEEGGNVVIGGNSRAEMSVTYNYSGYFHFKSLDGLTGLQSTSILAERAETLGTDLASNYWAATPGNTGYACNVLLNWARQHPSAVWKVT